MLGTSSAALAVRKAVGGKIDHVRSCAVDKQKTCLARDAKLSATEARGLAFVCEGLNGSGTGQRHCIAARESATGVTFACKQGAGALLAGKCV